MVRDARTATEASLDCSKRAEVFVALERMRMLDNELSSIVTDLESRLGTVMSPEGPSQATKDPAAVPSVYRVSEHIHDHCHEAEQLVARLMGILNRLEV